MSSLQILDSDLYFLFKNSKIKNKLILNYFYVFNVINLEILIFLTAKIFFANFECSLVPLDIIILIY